MGAEVCKQLGRLGAISSEEATVMHPDHHGKPVAGTVMATVRMEAR